MALTTKERRKYRELLDELKVFGLGGDFIALIDAAVRNDWTANEFTVRLTRTEAFRKKFPGLIVNGNINEALIGRAGVGVGTNTLGQAISNYQTMIESYNDAAKQYGFGKVTKQRFAALLKFEVSPDEFGQRLAAINTVQNNPKAWEAFQEQIKLSGGKLTPKDLYSAIANNRFADVYEATLIQTAGLGIGAEEASRLAKNVGAKGEVTANFAQALDYVRQNLRQVGPELLSQGINAGKLVKIYGAGGVGYAREMDIIMQTIATREGLYRSNVPGMYAREGSGGGLALYEDEPTASYG